MGRLALTQKPQRWRVKFLSCLQGKTTEQGSVEGAGREGMKRSGFRSHEAKHCLTAYCMPDCCRHTGYLSEQNGQDQC